ncbi:glutathione S-transferase [Ceratobasidium sp. AG-Ba]|nr:glutathione S-transferase [Ceratobasidium sp. AG-Ba]
MESSTKITVHHLSNSGSQRVLWLLEELGLSYEVKKYQRTPEGKAPPELESVHPLGKSPVIQDGDVTLAESAAIIGMAYPYGNGRFMPSESGYLDNLYYSRYSEGTLMPLYVHWLTFTIIPERLSFLLRPVLRPMMNMVMAVMVTPRLKSSVAMLEDHFSKRPGKFIAGGDEPTEADFLISFPLESFYARPESGLGENIKAYINLLRERPAFKRSLERSGSYNLRH